MSKIDHVADLPLDSDSRRLLIDGVGYWASGPLQATDEVASVFGCQDADHMASTLVSLHAKLVRHEALTMREAMRALLATELAWGSAVLGDPTDWWNVTGRSDGQTLEQLRGLQQELRNAGAPVTYLHPFEQ